MSAAGYSLRTPGFFAYKKLVYPRGSCKPVASSIRTRSKNTFLYIESYCEVGMSRGDLLSNGDIGYKGLEGLVYGGRGFQKQVLDTIHRNMLATKSINGNGYGTVCFKDEDQLHNMPADNKVTCTTFNILAPIYKRMDSEGTRESSNKEWWVNRNKSIIDTLLLKRSSIICLQEFWIQNEELVDMYEKQFQESGYEIYKLGRTNGCDDGLFTAVRRDHFKVLNYQALLFNDFGHRVAQLLHLRSSTPLLQNGKDGTQLEVILVNTHLIFPHNSTLCLVRLREVYKILEHLETFKEEHNLYSIPVIMCGDWNGSKRGQIYKFIKSQGYISSYDSAHDYTDGDEDAHRWVSHRNHRGNICGVDFIWLQNPNNDRKPLRTSWMEAVFGIIKSKLQESGLNNSEAFGFFKLEQGVNDIFTLEEFSHALHKLGLTGQLLEGLTEEEIEDLMLAADVDGNGIIDFVEFQKVMLAQSFKLTPITVVKGKISASEKCSALHFNGKSEPQLMQYRGSLMTKVHNNHTLLKRTQELEPRAPLNELDADPNLQDRNNLEESEIGFDVKGASFFPSEVEQAIWPDDYLMSDHAVLSAVFEPVRIP